MKDIIPGGLADNKSPEDFPEDALREGVEEEMEHTSDPDIATEIAMDHLTEDLDYYKKLKKIKSSWLILRKIAEELDQKGDKVLADDVDRAADLLIKEPKRTEKIDLAKIPDWEEGGGDNNIMNLLKQATQEEIDFWGKWYHKAHDHVLALAAQYNQDPQIVAAVCAVLSPGNTWAMNIRAAKDVLDGRDKTNAYPANIIKAQKILRNKDVSFVSGPKVSIFYQSLLDPSSVDKQLVLDSHAINLWRGKKLSLKQTSQPTTEERAQMIADYKRAAADTDLTVQAVQAITWYLWKSLGA